MLKTLRAPPVETTVGSHFVSNYPPFSCWTPDEIPKLEATLNRPVAIEYLQCLALCCQLLG